MPHTHVLALSATPYAASKAEEKDYLDRYHFHHIDSKMSGSIEWSTATERVDVDAFFEKARHFAKLIYYTNGILQALPAGIRVTETNCR